MAVYLSDTFQASLSKLPVKEQKAVKTTVFDFQTEGVKPGDKFHRVEKSKDTNFWSMRVNDDVRLIVHKMSDNYLLCYADHHDAAYNWARNRKIENHPKTGSLQIVVIPEVEKPDVPKRKPKVDAKFPLAHLTDEELLSHGVPQEWLDAVRQATEDTVLDLEPNLPQEAMEAVLQWVTGKKPVKPKPKDPDRTGFDHPDAQRRFRLIGTASELQQALNYPWDKWAVFLHPEQRKMVEADYLKPARVCGSAGTGKTIVALHRAFALARKHPDARVFLTTFTDSLANALKAKLKILGEVDPQVLERIDVRAIDRLGKDLYKARVGKEQLAMREQVLAALREAFENGPVVPYPFAFFVNECDHVLDAWQFTSADEYLKFPRSGTKRRLSGPQRQLIWDIYTVANAELTSKGLITRSCLFTQLASILTPEKSPYEFVVVDEAQDLSVAQLRFLAALGGNEKNRLFFAGDSGQQIFQRPFAWKDVGLDIRGRSKILKVNYRTSHDIRRKADMLLDQVIMDAIEGETENRNDVVSLFNGPQPIIKGLASIDAESEAVATWIGNCRKAGLADHEIALIVRGTPQFARAKMAAAKANVELVELDGNETTTRLGVRLATMHEAKGLEFKAVAVMACDHNVIPDMHMVDELGDDADIDIILDRERHLLYVACTRARDYLWVSGVNPLSEFVKDLETTPSSKD
jgi:mRNA-degrading endonuclease RelE of RelBE toxin-antitoxin system